MPDPFSTTPPMAIPTEEELARLVPIGAAVARTLGEGLIRLSAGAMTTPPLLAERAKLPDTRHSMTAKNSIGPFEFYVTVGFYDQDPTRPGEVFIAIAKEGSTLNGLCDALARTISLALQYGVPWEVLSEKYRNMRFEPLGFSARYNREYTSLVDAVADTVDEILRHRKSLWGSA